MIGVHGVHGRAVLSQVEDLLEAVVTGALLSQFNWERGQRRFVHLKHRRLIELVSEVVRLNFILAVCRRLELAPLN